MGIKKRQKRLLVSGQTDVSFNRSVSKGNQTFQCLWEEYKRQIAKEGGQTKTFDSLLIEYRKQIAHASSEFDHFREFLKDMPIIVVIDHWIKGFMTDEFWGEHYLPKMIKLQQRGVIPLSDAKGNLVPLDYLMQRGHQEILENIRCVDEWSILEKEGIIQCYVQFSHSLARQTFGIVAQGFDPDRDRVRYKAIKYESFIDFVQHLSERDALIAKLLYFGAPSLDEILSLKGRQIRGDDFSIQFNHGHVVLPRHLIRGLVTYQTTNGGAKKLVFTNVRGEEVERAHLNQSFARACEKMSKKIKITPGSLLKMANESIGENT